MKKLFLLSILLLAVLIPVLATAQAPFVQCGNTDANGKCIDKCPCEIEDFFGMLVRIYGFLVKDIAAPLAIFALTIGGIFILISAGNPNLLGTGKKIVYAALIGLFLVFASWLIVDLILGTLGYSMGKPWWQL